MMQPRPRQTRIQRKNTEAILEAALEVFSTYGFRGSTIDQIAEQAGLSKPNLLYYFASKEDIHVTLLDGLLHMWLTPLHALDPDGDPISEILSYVRRKLEMARDYPREGRLFANEILQGAPRIGPFIRSELKDLVDEKSAVIAAWAKAGRIADVDPCHLIFSIWATTQHYADFDAQVRMVLPEGTDAITDASRHLDMMFRKLLAPSRPPERTQAGKRTPRGGV